VLAVLLAPSCACCGEPLDAPLEGPVCAACWRTVAPLPPPLCARCGEPIPAWCAVALTLGRCRRCRRVPPLVVRSAAAGAYEGALRAAIHALKYGGRRTIARPLAGLMRVAGPDVLAGADVVVPVPLHPARLRARGFDQALDLARPLGPPVAALLRRVRATQPQSELPAARRHANVRGAFAATRGAARWRDATAVLVDDVRTTGATLEACAGTLRAAGLREVRALTAARAVRGRR
jgi:ComF family protein